MHMSKLKRCLTILVIGLIAQFLTGAIVSVMDLERLIGQSDFIAVGEVTEIEDVGRESASISGLQVPAHLMRGRLRIITLLKGHSVGSTVAFQFHIPDAPMGVQGINASSFRTLFLRSVAEGYEFTDIYRPSFVATRAVSYPQSDRELSNAEVKAAVVEITSQVIESAQTSDTEKLEALMDLSSERSPRVTKALEAAIRQTGRTLDFRISAMALLLKRNDADVFASAESVLTKPGAVPQYLRENLALAVQDVRGEQALQFLGAVLSKGDVLSRRSAAAAVRATGGSRAIPLLIQSLNDSDFEVRYYAVIGLAETTGQNDWRPLMDEFRQHQRVYLQHWRQWALVQ